MKDNSIIVQWLDEYCPDKAPLNYMNEYELGVLVGQRKLIEHIKIKLKFIEEKEEIK